MKTPGPKLALTLLAGFMAVLASAQSGGEPAPWHVVREPRDFLWSQEAHAQQRLPKLVRAIVAEDRLLPKAKQLYSQVEDWMLDEFFGFGQDAIHDSAKWNRDPAFLRRHGLAGKTPFHERLWEFHGNLKKEMKKEDRDRLNQVIAEMDVVEDAVRDARLYRMDQRKRMFTVEGYSRRAKQLFLLEVAADLTDRYLDPTTAEEFTSARVPADDYLTTRTRDHKFFKGKLGRESHVLAAKRAAEVYLKVMGDGDGFTAYKLAQLRRLGQNAWPMFLLDCADEATKRAIQTID
ncbi:MAG TPA: hypothetical protein VM598_01405 [Bdellovibrionota bacterium]|nr:hypothetical protein [Bdellovibrionota bacterium]